MAKVSRPEHIAPASRVYAAALGAALVGGAMLGMKLTQPH